MNLLLSRMHFPVTQLGPGRRIGIWFQGCSIRCLGCISVDTWAKDKSKIIQLKDVYELLDIWLPQADGVTISGGEPFDQIEALDTLLQYIKTNSEHDVLVYSGYSHAKIENKAAGVLEYIDVLISEPFERSVKQTKPLMGSDNQTMHLLSDLGVNKFSRYESKNLSANQKKVENRKLDVMFSDHQVWMAGVPDRNILPALKDKLRKQGHFIKHTQDTRQKSKD